MSNRFHVLYAFTEHICCIQKTGILLEHDAFNHTKLQNVGVGGRWESKNCIFPHIFNAYIIPLFPK